MHKTRAGTLELKADPKPGSYKIQIGLESEFEGTRLEASYSFQLVIEEEEEVSSEKDLVDEFQSESDKDKEKLSEDVKENVLPDSDE